MEILFFVLFIIYILPYIVAALREHKQVGAIFILNLFLGWTFIGWIAALIWACTNSEQPKVIVKNAETKTSAADELTKLAELKEKGFITEEEFAKKKAQILGL